MRRELDISAVQQTQLASNGKIKRFVTMHPISHHQMTRIMLSLVPHSLLCAALSAEHTALSVVHTALLPLRGN